MRACRRVLFAVASFAALFAAACAAPMQPPTGFVVLEDPGEGFRAITSDDARLRVRALAEPTKGGLDFWVDTLAQDLGARGYERKDQGEVKNAAGRTGRWLAFAANVQGEKVGYLVAVWVVEPTLPWGAPLLRVAEFAAVDAVFQARVEAVKAALATVKG
ncbi:MAG: hypothetical protein ACK5BN_11015 [Planctomycetota bacterium]